MAGEMGFPIIDIKATGAVIRRLMDRQGITARDVQNYLNLSSIQRVYHWFEGRNMPTVDNLYALSELLHTSVDSLIRGSRESRFSNFPIGMCTRLLLYFQKLDLIMPDD